MEQLRQHLATLANKIQQLVNIERPQPQRELYFQYDWEKFEYSKNGIDLGQGRGRQFDKLNWFKAHHTIKQKLLNTTSYGEASKIVSPFSSDTFDAQYTLKKFVDKVIEANLPTGSSTIDHTVKELIDRCIHQLQGQTVNAHASMYLIGITLESDSIHLDRYCTLRRTTPNDISIPTPVFPTIPISNHPFPTAVLDIKMVIQEHEQINLYQDIERSIDILKLFGVGGTTIKSTTVTTDSLISNIPHETHHTSGAILLMAETFYLDKSKEEKLKAFFPYMKKHMPDLSGQNRKTNRLTVSFDRYTEACMEFRIFERKVMTAIMGLEALYSKDNAELAHKLSMRCAKSMSFCGLAPLEVLKTVKVGYNIRSKFAHGDPINNKDLNKYTTEFSDHREIAVLLCNYLRISICAYTILKLDKDSFLDSLDYAMLTMTDNQKLHDQFSPLQQYLAL